VIKSAFLYFEYFFKKRLAVEKLFQLVVTWMVTWDRGLLIYFESLSQVAIQVVRSLSQYHFACLLIFHYCIYGPGYRVRELSLLLLVVEIFLERSNAVEID
jgi:hypothetical protein